MSALSGGTFVLTKTSLKLGDLVAAFLLEMRGDMTPFPGWVVMYQDQWLSELNWPSCQVVNSSFPLKNLILHSTWVSTRPCSPAIPEPLESWVDSVPWWNRRETKLYPDPSLQSTVDVFSLSPCHLQQPVTSTSPRHRNEGATKGESQHFLCFFGTPDILQSEILEIKRNQEVPEIDTPFNLRKMLKATRIFGNWTKSSSSLFKTRISSMAALQGDGTGQRAKTAPEACSQPTSLRQQAWHREK